MIMREIKQAVNHQATSEKVETSVAIDEEVAKRVSHASSEEVEPEKALDSAEETEAGVPNVNEAVASAPTSLREKFKAAFTRDNING